MIDGVDAGQRRFPGGLVPHVAQNEVSLGVKIRRLPLGVYGRLEVVQDPHPMPLPDESVDRVRTDETGSAGNQYVHIRLLAVRRDRTVAQVSPAKAPADRLDAAASGTAAMGATCSSKTGRRKLPCSRPPRA